MQSSRKFFRTNFVNVFKSTLKTIDQPEIGFTVCRPMAINQSINQSINQLCLTSVTPYSLWPAPVALGFRLELEFKNVGFWREGKTGVPGEKPLGARTRTNNKLNPHLTPGPGIEPGPHWWEASALTTAPFRLLCSLSFRISG